MNHSSEDLNEAPCFERSYPIRRRASDIPFQLGVCILLLLFIRITEINFKLDNNNLWILCDESY